LVKCGWRKARLADALEDSGGKTLRYLYDFGDGWEHTIKVERIEAAVPGVAYPRLIEAVGRCPPEDIGGPWGYEVFLAVMADPRHERHAELSEWIGLDAFDPNAVPRGDHARDVQALARQWSRKAAVKKPRRA
jgi:hypothetical protein